MERVLVRRVGSRPELELFAALRNRVAPREPVTVDELRHDLETEPDGVLLLVDVGGAPAGTGVGKPSSAPGRLFAMARVVAEQRRHGAGTALLAALSDHARALGRDTLQGRVSEEDADAMAFLAARGFVEVSRECEVVLTLAEAPPAATPPPGLSLVSLAERPDLQQAAWEVECETIVDIPAPEPLVPPSYASWSAANVTAPGALPEASFVALAGSDVVGYAGLTARGADEGTAEHLLTAVRRPWRGRGVASALKRAQIAWAVGAGLERLVTYTDARNDPMRGVNARLGYRAAPVQLVVRGPLVAAPAAGDSH